MERSKILVKAQQWRRRSTIIEVVGVVHMGETSTCLDRVIDIIGLESWGISEETVVSKCQTLKMVRGRRKKVMDINMDGEIRNKLDNQVTLARWILDSDCTDHIMDFDKYFYFKNELKNLL